MNSKYSDFEIYVDCCTTWIIVCVRMYNISYEDIDWRLSPTKIYLINIEMEEFLFRFFSIVEWHKAGFSDHSNSIYSLYKWIITETETCRNMLFRRSHLCMCIWVRWSFSFVRTQSKQHLKNDLHLWSIRPGVEHHSV